MPETRTLEFHLDSPSQLLEEFVHTWDSDHTWLPEPLVPHILSSLCLDELNEVDTIKIVFSTAVEPQQLRRIEKGVSQYLQALLSQKEHGYRQFKKDRWRAIIAGTLLLGVFVVLYYYSSQETAPEILRVFAEAFIVLGWVAMWQPAEMVLFDWVPLQREINIIKRLQKITFSLG